MAEDAIPFTIEPRLLPDYHELKAELTELLERFMQKRMAFHLGFIGTLPKVRIFEGNRSSIRRSAGDISSNELQELSILHSVSDTAAEQMTFRHALGHLDEIAAKMAKELSELAYKQLNETLEEAGQVVEAKGEAMTGAFLRAMDQIAISFDADGNHSLKVVVHPQEQDAALAALKALDEDPDLRQRYKALIERKQEEWRVREASRRLVG